MIENNGHVNEISLERITRNNDALTPRVSTTLKMAMGKETVQVVDESLPQDSENFLKLQEIKCKLDVVSSKLIKLATKLDNMDRDQNLFYASVNTWNKSIVVAMSNLSPSPLHEFPKFPPIICGYDFSTNEDEVGHQIRQLPYVEDSNCECLPRQSGGAPSKLTY
ncbi:hypothetical protein V6N13_063766 [Hibiscus sabdariffa]